MGIDGYSSCTITVPQANLQDKTVTVNKPGTSTVTYNDNDYDGLGTVTINCEE